MSTRRFVNIWPVGTVGVQAAALLYAARRGSVGHGAAHLPAGHYAKPAGPLRRCGAGAYNK